MKPLLLLALGVLNINRYSVLLCGYVIGKEKFRNRNFNITGFFSWYKNKLQHLGLVLFGVLLCFVLIDNTNSEKDFSEFALQIDNFKKTYKGEVAFKGYFIKEKKRGDFYAFLGPNGAGKSSTLGKIGT
ncbi:MAG: hypothetical protein CM15mP126_0010 [Gammaproteobacteria bacterium]|nr:MAG: hypothetical protein CM15mP126_0010 [Gammaproteobacteria bacterium]